MTAPHAQRPVDALGKRLFAALLSGRPTASLRPTPPPRLLHHAPGRRRLKQAASFDKPAVGPDKQAAAYDKLTVGSDMQAAASDKLAAAFDKQPAWV